MRDFMKSYTIAFVCLFPLILHAQGTPDTGNSKLWEMRKKVQQRSTQRAGSYLEQMNQSLASGDSANAETALKSAIAQGSMTQSQIDDARGQIDSLVSRQRMAVVAEARVKRENEAREAEVRSAAAMQTAQTHPPADSLNVGEPDHSDETMAKLRPLLPQAEAAYDRGDYPESFAIYLKMWEGCHLPIVRNGVLTAAWKCIDQAAVERGRDQAHSVYAILNKCPAPLFTEKGYSDASYGLESGIYGFIQYVLSQKANNNRDFDSSANYLARAQIYFERANELDPETADIERRRDFISEAKDILQRNGRIEQYYGALNSIRNIFSGGNEIPSSTPAKAGSELDRFKAHWRGRTALFTVTSDNGGTALDGTSLVVRDSDTGKKFKVHYNVGFSQGIFDDDVKSAVGHTVSIRFGDDGFPSSIKNPDNGRGTQTSSGGGWVVEGFGW